jgi:hypothetical protein
VAPRQIRSHPQISLNSGFCKRLRRFSPDKINC